MKTRQAANHRGVVAIPAVAVDLAPVGEDALDIIERMRTLHVARQLRLLHGIGPHQLLAQGFNALLQLDKLAASFVSLAGGGLHLGRLAFNLFQFLLCLL